MTATPQLEAAWRLHCFLTERGILYVVIGGIAVQHWGEPRFTRDVDVTVMVEPGSERAALEEILSAFPPRIDDALAFALAHRVVLITVPDLCDADISLGLPGYESEVMQRAIEHNIGGGRLIRLCSAEDLIIHKAVACRPQDIADIEGVLIRQKDRLDLTYVRGWLAEFSEVLDKPEIRDQFEALCRTAGIEG